MLVPCVIDKSDHEYSEDRRNPGELSEVCIGFLQNLGYLVKNT